MNIRAIVLAAIGLLAMLPSAQASTPHYVNGSLGLGAATLPPEGFYYSMLNTNYYASQIRDQNGDKVWKGAEGSSADFKLEVFIQAHSFVWASKYKILGARWLADIAVPLLYMDIKADVAIPLPFQPGIRRSVESHSFGLTDFYVEPLSLIWEKDRFSITLTSGVFVPVGKYDQNNPTSVGKGFWTFKQGLGGTVYFDEKKEWSASILAGYEIHSKQRQTHTKPGDHFHFEWGVGKRFAKYWQAGVVGYDSWQVTKDQGGTNAAEYKTSVHGVGGEIDVAIEKIKAQISLRSIWEYRARYSTLGNTTTLSAAFSF